MGTRSPDKLPSLSRRARRLMILGLGLIVLMTVGPRLVDVYVNWLWFGEVGFRRVWITVLLTRSRHSSWWRWWWAARCFSPCWWLIARGPSDWLWFGEVGFRECGSPCC